MTWEDNYLAHHGIIGQRWGVRRYQNEDGSLTGAGLERYGTHHESVLGKQLKDNAKEIAKRTSNRYSRFQKKPISLEKVKQRGNLGDYEALQCAHIASKLFKKKAKDEPKITKDVVSAVADSGNKMYGLEERLKQPTSLAAKIGQDAKEDDISFEKAASGINDTIRYTSISDGERFTESYNSIKAKLEKKGYREVRCKNYYDLYREGKAKHKSVQCVYEDKKGNVFEIQFHTPESQSAKGLKIPIYEERRRSDLTNERKMELENQMTKLAEGIPDPKDVFSIKSHG